MNFSHLLLLSFVFFYKNYAIFYPEPTTVTPWMAFLWNHHWNSETYCGAAVISDDVVLTAAHCVLDYENKTYSDNKVYFMSYRDPMTFLPPFNGSFMERVRKVVVTPTYLRKLYDESNLAKHRSPATYDLALLFLEKPIPVCVNASTPVAIGLPYNYTNNQILFIGGLKLEQLDCLIKGYGMDDQWFTPAAKLGQMTALIEGIVFLGHQDDGEFIRYKSAKNPETKPCGGDSGGPLVCKLNGRQYVFGVNSDLDGFQGNDRMQFYCMKANYSMATYVPGHMSWIMETIKKETNYDNFLKVQKRCEPYNVA